MADPKRLSVPSNPARALRDLSRRQTATPVEEGGEEYTTVLQRDKPTDTQTDSLTDQQTIKQEYPPTDTLTNQHTDTPTDRQPSRQTDAQATRPRAASPRKASDGDRPAKSASPTVTGAAVPPAPAVAEAPALRRADGRTSRPRQETADRTLVTSLRLAVTTIELLDEYCWRHRQRKQDVVQAALDLYFAATEADE